MRIAWFAHSWLSDWNHGNAHFLRGLTRALCRRGHQLQWFEPLSGPWGGWSLQNLVRQEPLRWTSALRDFNQAYPEIRPIFYPLPNKSPQPLPVSGETDTQNGLRQKECASAAAPFRMADQNLLPDSRRVSKGVNLISFLKEPLQDMEWVVVHEWSDAELIQALKRLRHQLGFRLIWHDTHHRGISRPEEIEAYQIHDFDAVVAFGESLRWAYETRFHARRSYTLHEAADLSVFHPAANGGMTEPAPEVIWIGNWGDEERTRELEEFLLEPARRLRGHRFQVYGVRYPADALQRLRRAGIAYSGYLPNPRGPEAYAHGKIALHSPRQAYRESLPGVPTIRVFETLACGIALLCSPWPETEGLLEPGADYECAGSGREMEARIEYLLRHDDERRSLARHGMESVRQRHSCAHRAREWEAICQDIG